MSARDLHRFSFYAVLTILPVLAITQTSCWKGAPPQTVVFVCQHGAAKSVIAAAYFNKLAAERHLNFHAIARGTTPQAELSDTAVAGLKEDGVAFPEDKPRGLTEKDVRKAVRMVAFCPLPPSYAKILRVESHDVPEPQDGYDKSRDAILRYVEQIIDELQASSSRR